MAAQACAFRSCKTAVVRAAAGPALNLPPWPDLTGPASDATAAASQIAWLRTVQEADGVAEGLRYASSVLAARVRALCEAENPAPRDIRRAVLSVARYLLRWQSRATPFGLFAGVATASFGTNARAGWGSEHRAVARAAAEWLTAVTARLEGCPDLLARLPVVANSSLMIRGDRLIVPYQPNSRGPGPMAVEVSLRCTAPASAALAAARAPVRVDDLGAKLLAGFPAAGPERVTAMLADLVATGALITCLHPPSTETDALGYLLSQLEAVGAGTAPPVADFVLALREIHADLARCAARPTGHSSAARERVTARMNDLAPVRRHPLAVDLRLDATITLPWQVAREAERAALALARVSAAPYGTPAWKAYHQRFYERFGIGSMVPVLDVIADSGLGFPDGYPGSQTAEHRSPVSSRDEALVRLAQSAALDGRDEVVVDQELIASLQLGPGQVRLPGHLELGVRVHAASAADLQRGDFRLEVVSVSRSAGVGTGRFLSVLNPQDRGRLAAELADLPGPDASTVTAQLSFPPLLPETAHVTRSPQILPTVISLAEHRGPGDHVLTVQDLAVGCDGRRMYLAAPARGHRVEAVSMHALNLHTHTPPLARFLAELSRAQCAAVTLFDWGAARTMPFLPRLRYGRTILAPARWRLEAAELPARSQPWTAWDNALAAWRATRRLPRRVYLTEGDRLLALDLDQPGHRVLLRAHLDGGAPAVLTEGRVPARPPRPARPAALVVRPVPRSRPASAAAHRPVRSRRIRPARPCGEHVLPGVASRRAAAGGTVRHLLSRDWPLGLRGSVGRGGGCLPRRLARRPHPARPADPPAPAVPCRRPHLCHCQRIPGQHRRRRALAHRSHPARGTRTGSP